MPFVIDASIAACWAFRDEDHPLAALALERMRSDEALAPSLWWRSPGTRSPRPHFARIGNTVDLMLTFSGSAADSILVKGGLGDGSNRIEAVRIGASSISIAAIRAQLLAAQTTTGSDTIVGFDGSTNSIKGDAGNDALTGGKLNDTISGDAGADVLSGMDGDDLLRGGTENDTLFGGYGTDRLYGDDGNDLLNGGHGADSLTGGTGADTFYLSYLDFGLGAASDTIMDFRRAEGDKIQLHGFGSTPYALNGTGSLSTTVNSMNYAFGTDANGAAVTNVFIDSNHNGTADQQIVLRGKVALVAGDFVFA